MSSEEVRQFYTDNAAFEQLINLMMTEANMLDDLTSPLRYHIELVRYV